MRSARHRRAGWALLELLVVISAVTVLLAMAAGLVFQMLRIDGAERSRVFAAANLERLARDLRGDAHASSGPSEGPADRMVLPQTEGRTVEYAVRPRDVLRTARRGDKVERREEYRVPTATRGRFESTRDGERTIVAFILDPDPSASGGKLADPGYRGFRIEAMTGRDARVGGGGAR